MSTILIILVLILLLGGGGYYGHSTYGGAGLAAFLVLYWSLPSWSGWLAAWVSAVRPPGRDILYGTRASGLAMIRHLIEQPAGW